ncbi:SRPBCC family protein [Flexithrix dorotheae]|uniref:SRPBCC family protein n=1 Tax=Flexithrix dorotheae TaxID=70993 RepID=UPI00036EE276|nr:hypothetical protein [Flexithrix dorotheae]
MEIIIKTKVEQSIQKVWKGFDKRLLLKFSPPFPKVSITRFDGSQKGNEVHLKLDLIFFNQEWKSLITQDFQSEAEMYFIDEGTQLPFFLKFWKHKHLMEKKDEGTLIIDHINFKTPYIFTDFLFYPLLYFQFLYRKPIYKKEFKRNYVR